MHDPVDDGYGKTETAGRSLVTHLAVFLNHVRGRDFSAALQIDRIGKNTPGNG